MNAGLVGSRWDDEYRRGRYLADPPLPFVHTVLATLRGRRDLWEGVGLYVGCGNGRNYWPLVDAGANLDGVDVSSEAIRRLRDRRPGQVSRLRCEDFRSLENDVPFSYIVAIQVFQHGGDADVARYFERVAAMLRASGLFFLRVNSVATEIYHDHTVIERNGFGGLTIRYDDGPKRGLLVHFYSREELLARTASHFELVIPPRQDVIRRAPPKTGSWAQWEVAWQRR